MAHGTTHSKQKTSLHSYEKAKTVYWDMPSTGRTIVISDIHGHLEFFQGLLDKIKFTTEDHLVLLGDMLEKGRYTLKTIRFIQSLQQTHPVHIVAGNYEEYLLQFFEKDSANASFFDTFLTYNRHSLIFQMAREAGLSHRDSLLTIQKKVRVTHKDIWDWLKTLPTIITTPQYLFVHGGLPQNGDLDNIGWLNEQVRWDCMRQNHFLRTTDSFSKYVVVGHHPSTLYHHHIPDSSPIVDAKRHIISIDGACVLKKDGQLNALILEEHGISWDYYDGLPLVRVLEQQTPSSQSINVRFGHNRIKVLEKGADRSLCLHLESKTTLEILNQYIRKNRSGQLCCEDSTNYRLPVEAGDVISLSIAVEGGFLGKKNGVTGWYFGEYTSI